MSEKEANVSSSMKIKPIRKKKKGGGTNIYSSTILTQTVHIPITNIGKNIETVLKNIVSENIEGKCIPQGYIKPDSVDIISYSNGVQNGYNVVFEIVVECKVCNPVEGMHITCIAKNITKAGIKAELSDENNPIIIFIARDHNYNSKVFSSIEENQEIKVRVIGQRFELNDKYISVIGELINGIKTKVVKTPLKLDSKKKNASSVIDDTVISVSSVPSVPSSSKELVKELVNDEFEKEE